MALNRDEFGFDAPVELGHPIRAVAGGALNRAGGRRSFTGFSTARCGRAGNRLSCRSRNGEGGRRLLSLRCLVTPLLDAARGAARCL